MPEQRKRSEPWFLELEGLGAESLMGGRCSAVRAGSEQCLHETPAIVKAEKLHNGKSTGDGVIMP